MTTYSNSSWWVIQMLENKKYSAPWRMQHQTCPSASVQVRFKNIDFIVLYFHLSTLFCTTVHKVTTLLVDGRRVRLQLWDTSGQGRFCTILRSYSRGAQGLLLVYDITNKWSFDGIDRWRREVEEVIIFNFFLLLIYQR